MRRGTLHHVPYTSAIAEDNAMKKSNPVRWFEIYVQDMSRA
jgi:hypothetical protein